MRCNLRQILDVVGQNRFQALTFSLACLGLILSVVGLWKRDTPWTAVVLGFVLAVLGNYFIECIKRGLKRTDDRRFLKHTYEVLSWEVVEGINRCRGLIDMKQQNKFSYSRIGTSVWELVGERVMDAEEDDRVMGLLARIYYRFDLINFNMEKDRFAVGAAFAEQYIEEMGSNFQEYQALTCRSN